MARADVVLKVGGAHLSDDRDVACLVDHVSAMRAAGRRVCVVHGGKAQIAELHERLGLHYRRSLGLRITSDASLDIVTMVLCGLINTRLVARFQAAGQRALGVSGVDDGLLQSHFINRGRLGHVGGPPRVATGRLRALMNESVVVLSPVCLGPSGEPINVSADAVAQSVAIALDADGLEFVTAASAIATEHGPARHLSPSELELLVAESAVQGPMITKLHAVLAALDGGVRRVRLGSLDSLSRGTATEVSAA